MGLQQIIYHWWWEFSPLSFYHVIVSHTRLTFIDKPEVLPGQVPGAPSSSSSSVRGSSTSTTATHAPVPTGGHSSHGGAIAGGVVGGVAVISLLVAGLVFYQRRRRSLESSSAVPLSPGDGSFNAPSPMDQLPRPMLDPGTLASSFPETTSLMKPYVRVFVAPSSTCMCSMLF
jgi:hypothetical protein